MAVREATYTDADRETALKEVIDAAGFPRLEAWNKMTPKMLRTIMAMYSATMAPNAFEFFDAFDIEVIYAAASSVNNCELCLSFHSMTLGDKSNQGKISPKDIREIVDGGLPNEPKARNLVIATKYSMAHKGIVLEREKLHLASLGFAGEKLVELNFLVAAMSAFNQNYIHLISNGLEIEPMLQNVGPFKDTVYKDNKQ